MTEPLPVFEALVVKPGDTLILRSTKPLSMATAQLVQERLKARLPDVPAVLIDGFDQMAVYRPDPIKIIDLEPKVR